MNTYLNKVTKSNDLENKMKAREFLLGFFSDYTQLTGLAGPNIDVYLDWCVKHKFKDIKVYEKDLKVIMEQLPKVKNTPISLIYGDIGKEIPKKEVFYDLDYCGTILNMEEEIKKYTGNNFIMTFSRRLVGNATIDRFFEIRKEIVKTVKKLTSPVEHTRYVTNKGGYIYVPYHDTSAMCCIAKIK